MSDPPRTSPSSDDPVRRLARRLLHGSIVVGLLSAGGACAVYVLFVVPWTLASFQRAELPVPRWLGAIADAGWLTAGAILAVAACGILALRWKRSPLAGVILAGAALAMLTLAAVAGLISWWMLYIEAMRAQMSS